MNKSDRFLVEKFKLRHISSILVMWKLMERAILKEKVVDPDPQLYALLTTLQKGKEGNKKILTAADVIGEYSTCVTCASSYNQVLLQSPFPCHVLILDEATQ
eukprot:gene39641-52286_t